MASVGWIKLRRFNLPLTYRLKYRLSGLLTGGRIRTSYRNSHDGVLIRTEFDGETLETVLQNLSGLLKEWGRQNEIHI